MFGAYEFVDGTSEVLSYVLDAFREGTSEEEVFLKVDSRPGRGTIRNHRLLEALWSSEDTKHSDLGSWGMFSAILTCYISLLNSSDYFWKNNGDEVKQNLLNDFSTSFLLLLNLYFLIITLCKWWWPGQGITAPVRIISAGDFYWSVCWKNEFPSRWQSWAGIQRRRRGHNFKYRILLSFLLHGYDKSSPGGKSSAAKPSKLPWDDYLQILSFRQPQYFFGRRFLANSRQFHYLVHPLILGLIQIILLTHRRWNESNTKPAIWLAHLKVKLIGNPLTDNYSQGMV